MTSCPFGWIETHSGLQYQFAKPTVEMICAEDIAWALSKICRFGGHSWRHYSVAEHSILVIAMVPPIDRLQALLHDATEAYVGDIVAPIKRFELGDWKALEFKCREVICKRFNIPHDLPESVKKADRHALYLEAQVLFARDYHMEPWWEAFYEEELSWARPMLIRQPVHSEIIYKNFLELLNAAQ